MKASTSRARFPGRAGDPERQHHAAVMTKPSFHFLAQLMFVRLKADTTYASRG